MRSGGIIAALLLVAAPVRAQTRIGAFSYIPATDRMTDVDRSMVTSRELNSIASRTAAVTWRCDGPDIDFFVFADEFLKSEDPVTVQWRFDERPSSVPAEWAVATTGTGAFAPRDLVPFLSEQARKASRLAIRTTDYRGVRRDAEFSMSGATAALQRLKCAPPRLQDTWYEDGKSVIMYDRLGASAIDWFCTDPHTAVAFLTRLSDFSSRSTVPVLLDGKPYEAQPFQAALGSGVWRGAPSSALMDLVGAMEGVRELTIGLPTVTSGVEPLAFDLGGSVAAIRRLPCYVSRSEGQVR